MGRTRFGRYRFPLVFWGLLASTMLVLQHVSSRVLRDSGYRLWPLQGWEQALGVIPIQKMIFMAEQHR